MVVEAAGVFDEMSLVKLKSVEVQDTDSYYEKNIYVLKKIWNWLVTLQFITDFSGNELFEKNNQHLFHSDVDWHIEWQKKRFLTKFFMSG